MTSTATTVRQIVALRMGILLLSSLLWSPAASAHQPASTFEMTVISDAAYGGKIASGKHDAAIAQIDSSTTRQSQRFFASINLCVAYTKVGELEKAEQSCASALEAVMTKDRSMPKSLSRITRRYQAMALSNRGVLRALAGDTDRARQDFRAAIELRAGLSAPVRNLEYLEIRDAQASTALQTDH